MLKRLPPPTGTVERAMGGFKVVGFDGQAIAFVEVVSGRGPEVARPLADRICRDPAGYLAACADFRVPGVRDLRGPARQGRRAPCSASATCS